MSTLNSALMFMLTSLFYSRINTIKYNPNFGLGLMTSFLCSIFGTY